MLARLYLKIFKTPYRKMFEELGKTHLQLMETAAYKYMACISALENAQGIKKKESQFVISHSLFTFFPLFSP